MEKNASINSLDLIPKNCDQKSDIDLFDPSKLPDYDDDDEIPFKIINPFEDGILAHRNQNYKEAWECFNDHADLGYSLAKYWKGYYLEKGFHVEKNEKEALEWIRQAADEGVPDAQFRYAIGLVTSVKSSENDQIILKYMRKAFEGGHKEATYKLGDIYYYGKLGVKADKEKGMELIKLAALNNHQKALNFVRQNGS